MGTGCETRAFGFGWPNDKSHPSDLEVLNRLLEILQKKPVKEKLSYFSDFSSPEKENQVLAVARSDSSGEIIGMGTLFLIKKISGKIEAIIADIVTEETYPPTIRNTRFSLINFFIREAQMAGAENVSVKFRRNESDFFQKFKMSKKHHCLILK